MSYHPLPVVQSPLRGVEKDGDHETPLFRPGEDEIEAPTASKNSIIVEEADFEHYEETSNIQLLFDLFFVANLTSFTSKHEVNDAETLSSYIGFFVVLWFTWFQVTLYDVRFSTDSVFERIAHGLHFGVMVGLAIVGPQFAGFRSEDRDPLRTMSFIFMASRLILSAQYGHTMIFLWKYTSSRLALMIFTVTMFISAMVYLGLSFAFVNENHKNAYVTWYIMISFELAVQIIISRKFKTMTFSGTHIQERMSCLTLIILGEGVIGLCTALTKISEVDHNYSSKTIGSICSAVIIIYLLYMLYFDNVPEDVTGAAQRAVWTMMHFPFHIALVLLMEGINQVLSWEHLNDYVGNLFNPLIQLSYDESATQEQFAVLWNQTASEVVTTFSNLGLLNLSEIIDQGEKLADYLAVLSDNETTHAEYNSTVPKLVATLADLIYPGYGFPAPPTAQTDTLPQTLKAYAAVFKEVFGYYFLCAGLVLIFLSFFTFLTFRSITLPPGSKPRLHYLDVAIKALLGIGLALLPLLQLTHAARKLGDTPWTLTVVVIVLLIALVSNYVPRGLILVGGPGRKAVLGLDGLKSWSNGKKNGVAEKGSGVNGQNGQNGNNGSNGRNGAETRVEAGGQGQAVERRAVRRPSRVGIGF